MKTAYMISSVFSAINISIGALMFLYICIQVMSSSGCILLDILIGIGSVIIGGFCLPAILTGALSLLLARIGYKKSSVVPMVISYVLPAVFDIACVIFILKN